MKMVIKSVARDLNYTARPKLTLFVTTRNFGTSVVHLDPVELVDTSEYGTKMPEMRPNLQKRLMSVMGSGMLLPG